MPSGTFRGKEYIGDIPTSTSYQMTVASDQWPVARTCDLSTAIYIYEVRTNSSVSPFR